MAVLYPIEFAVAEVRADGGEDSFQAPAAVLAGMIVEVAGNREEVFNSVMDSNQGFFIARKVVGESPDDAALEGGVVGKDRAALAAVLDKSLRELFSRIVSAEFKEVVMM